MIHRRVPDQIGRYQILSELGRGSMGDVYLALDPNIERRVALKVLLPLLKVGVREEAELRQRFLVEARAAGKLKHPGVVTLFDADTDLESGLSFIAMEWVDGPSLHDLVRQSGNLAVPRALKVFEQVAYALEAAHQADLVHRDIKPANILLTAADQAKITDFGIAKLACMSITATGWVPGSPFYMSPEQVRGQDVDGRSDVYSLGVSLYQCLTGEVPFQSDSLAGVTYMILEVDPRPPQPLNPEIPDQLAAVMQRSMEKDPTERFQSALEFAESLREISSKTQWSFGRSQHVSHYPVEERSDTVRLEAARDAGPESQPRPAAPESAPAVAIHARAESQRSSSIPASPLARYALAGVGMLLLLLVGPAPRTSASQDQRPVPVLVEATSPFSQAAQPTPGPVALGEVALAPSLEPPAFEPVVEGTQLDLTSAPPANPVPMHPLEKPAPVQAPALAKALPVRAPPRKAAQLEIVFKNRLKNAEVSIWIDEEKVWSRAVAAPSSLFKRAVGRNVFTVLPIVEGVHVIDVRVIGLEGKIDVVRRTEAKFVSGETRRLKVATVPPKKLKLSWADQNNG